ncbi:MAG: hypothetical protein ACQ9ET_04620 [Nitrosomonadaceae bacterium]
MITVDELRKMGGRIAYTPVGLIRIEPNKYQLYHFYSPDAPPILEENVHTHPQSFKSTVIKGGIRNHIYRVDDVMEETDYCVRCVKFRVPPALQQSSTKTAKVVRKNVSYEKCVTFDTYEGNNYDLHYTTMHEVEILEPKTATILDCRPHIGAYPDVFFVMGKDVSYTKEQLHNRKTEKECWEIVADVLA